MGGDFDVAIVANLGGLSREFRWQGVGSLIEGTLLTLLVLGYLALWVQSLRSSRSEDLSGKRSWSMFAARFCTFMLLVMLFFGPTIVTLQTLPGQAVVLVDDSKSMTLPLRGPDQGTEGESAALSRFDRIRQILKGKGFTNESEANEEFPAGDILRSVDLRLMPLSVAIGEDETSALPEEMLLSPPAIGEVPLSSASANATPLGSVVDQVRKYALGGKVQAIVLLTDGVVTEGIPLERAAENARRGGVRLISVAVGDWKMPTSVRLAAVRVPKEVFLGDPVVLEAVVFLEGGEGEGALQAQVLQEGPVDSEKASLAEEELSVTTKEGGIPLRLSFVPRFEGDRRYRLAVKYFPGRGESVDASVSFSVRVHREPIRVLYIEGRPRFEYRFLRELLRQEDAFAVETVLMESDPAASAFDETTLAQLPRAPEEMDLYDLVILGDVAPERLGNRWMEEVRRWLESNPQGKGVVLIAGRRFMPNAYGDTPLSGFLPSLVGEPAAFRETRLQVMPTRLGMLFAPFHGGRSLSESREKWRSLPQLFGYCALSTLRPDARILAEASFQEEMGPTNEEHVAPRLPSGPNSASRAVICRYYIGANRVVWHGTDQTWRWRKGAGIRDYRKYWSGMLWELARSSEARPQLRLESDRQRYHSNEAIRLWVRVPPGGDRHLLKEGGLPVELRRLEGAEGEMTKEERTMIARVTEEDPLLFEATVSSLPAGTWRATVDASLFEGGDLDRPGTSTFEVAFSEPEFRQKGVAKEELAQAAEISNGAFFEDDRLSGLPESIATACSPSTTVVGESELVHRWPLLLMMLLLFAWQWWGTTR